MTRSKRIQLEAALAAVMAFGISLPVAAAEAVPPPPPGSQHTEGDLDPQAPGGR